MHEGHRNRLVSKVREGGIVYEHELMEILLFNSCPRKDLNATAHAVIKRFGSIEGALKADCADLAKVDGVGVNMAEYLAVLGKALNAVRDMESFAVVSNVKDFKEYVLSRPVPTVDCLELYCIDKDGRVRRICSFKAEAGLRAEPEASEILKLLSAHHPYGLFAASRRAGDNAPAVLDDTLCETIYNIAKLCGARLYDYCCVGADAEFYSYKMADRSVFAEKFTGGGYGE